MPPSDLTRHLIPDLPQAEDILPWLKQIDSNRWYTNYGPLVQEFERQMQALLAAANPGRDVALTTLSTGYHALEYALRAFRLAPRSTVLMPAVTFPACPQAALNAGLMPLLADIDRDHWNLAPETARRIAGKAPLGAVMPVAVYGVPVDAAAWDEFARDTGIPVIIDAAAAVETQPIPAHCLVAHSLHATKPFGIGEGGLLVGANKAQIAHARELSNFSSRERIAYMPGGSNGKMSEFHAAVALAQMRRWTAIKQRRAAMLARYQAALADLPIRLQHAVDRATPSLLMARHDRLDAVAVMTALRRSGIATHQTYLPPLYRHPAFTDLAVASLEGKIAARRATPARKAKLCPNAEAMADHVFGLPFHPFLGEDAFAAIGRCLTEAA